MGGTAVREFTVGSERGKPRWPGTNSVATKGIVGSVNLLTSHLFTKRTFHIFFDTFLLFK
jgi:hypothetical protein